jgi:hypothetical protein
MCQPPAKKADEKGGKMMSSNQNGWRFVLLVLTLGVIAGLTLGCSTTQVKPQLVTAPAHKYLSVAIGEITVQDKLWQDLVPHFRHGLAQGLVADKAFAEVLDPAPETLSESTLLLTGKITEVNKGSTALRWIVGLGAGKAKIKGSFEIRGSDGKSLAKFDAQESYSGGAGLGGANLLDMQDLMGNFGKAIAKRTIRWSKGEKI